MRLENVETLGEISGAELGELRRASVHRQDRPVLAGDTFVENSTGSGFVHIAPGHGLEDYGLGSQNGLPIYSPVDDAGKLSHTDDLPAEAQMPAELVGQSILEKNGTSEANEAVLALLRRLNRLVHHEKYSHSYPHCWRSKTPVIFRAMDQWFIKIDHENFRQQALAAINEVNWVPGWARTASKARWKAARLVHQPPTHLGRADPGVLCRHRTDPRCPHRA